MSKKPPQKGHRRSLSEAITDLQRNKIADQKVVDLQQYRHSKRGERLHSILVVDSDELMRNAVKRTLETENYKVLQAADAMELSDVMESSSLDLILLEVNLPWVNGYELCEILKSHPDVKHIPVVLVAAKGHAQDPDNLARIGCDGFVFKPIESETLSKTLSELLRKSA